MTIKVDEEDLDFDGENYAEYQGVEFTGYSIENDGNLVNFTSFLGGRSCGVQFSTWKGSGGLSITRIRHFEMSWLVGPISGISGAI